MDFKEMIQYVEKHKEEHFNKALSENERFRPMHIDFDKGEEVQTFINWVNGGDEETEKLKRVKKKFRTYLQKKRERSRKDGNN